MSTTLDGYLDLPGALRDRRDKLGLTQEAIASQLGIRQASYAAWELGYHWMRPATEERLEQVLRLAPGGLRRLAAKRPRVLSERLGWYVGWPPDLGVAA